MTPKRKAARKVLAAEATHIWDISIDHFMSAFDHYLNEHCKAAHDLESASKFETAVREWRQAFVED